MIAFTLIFLEPWLSGANSGRPQKTSCKIIVPSAYITHTAKKHPRKKDTDTNKETGSDLTSYHPLFTVAVFPPSISLSLSLFHSCSRSHSRSCSRPLSLYLHLSISCSLCASVCLSVCFSIFSRNVCVIPGIALINPHNMRLREAHVRSPVSGSSAEAHNKKRKLLRIHYLHAMSGVSQSSATNKWSHGSS